MTSIVRNPRPKQKSTNGRFKTVTGLGLGAIVLGLALLAAPVAVASGGCTLSATAIPSVSLEMRTWALDAVPSRGADIARLRRLHEALTANADVGTTGDGFASTFVALSREIGVDAYYVLVDRAQPATEGGVTTFTTHLAAGYGLDGRVVVFDALGVSRPKHRTLQVLTDQRAAAVLQRNAGLALLRSGALDAAIVRLEAAVQLDPGMATAWSALGSALREVGRSTAALDAYERSIDLAYAR